MDDIAKAAAAFKRDLDKIYNTGISIDETFEIALNKLAQNGINLNRTYLYPLIKKIKNYEPRRNKALLDYEEILDFDDIQCKRNKEEELVMPVGAAIGCVEIFCGILLCIIPSVYTQALGGGVIANGVKDIITAYAEENQKKKLWIESYYEIFPLEEKYYN